MADDRKIIIELNTKGIDEAKKGVEGLKGEFSALNIATKIFPKLTNKVVKATKSMVAKMNKAMLKNPFTLIALAITLVIAGIVKFVSSTEQGMDRIKKAVAPIIGAFEAMKGIMQDLFLGNEVGDWTQRIKDGAAAQQEIERLAISIRNEETKLIELRGRTTQILKEQELIANDTSKSVEERRKASKAANEAATRLAEKDLALQDEKIAKMKLEQSTNETTSEQAQELATLIAERYDLEGRLTDVKLKYLGIDKSILDQEKAIAQAAADRLQSQQDLSQSITDALNNASYDLALENADGFYSELQLKQKKADDTLVEARDKEFVNLKKTYKDYLDATKDYDNDVIGKLKAHNEQVDNDNKAAYRKALEAYRKAKKEHIHTGATKDEEAIVAKAKKDKEAAKSVYIETHKNNKTLEEQHKEYTKNVSKVWNKFNKGRELNNKKSSSSVIAHTKQVNSLLRNLQDSASVDNISDEASKNDKIFKNKQESDKRKFEQTLDNLKVVNSTEEGGRQEATELRDAFQKAQEAELREHNRRKQEAIDNAEKERQSKAKDAAQKALDTMSDQNEKIRELDAEFTASAVEASNAHYDEQQEKLTEQRQSELDAVVGQKELIKKVNEKYDKLDIKNLKAKAKSEREINAMRWNAKMGLVNAMANASQAMFADTMAGEKAALAVSKGAAIAQIWVSNAIANAKATAAFPLTAGLPFTAINTTTAVVQTAGVVAQAAKGMASINKAHQDKPSSGTSASSGNRYHNGGIVTGPPAGDVIDIKAEGGELISNQKQKDNMLLAIQNGQIGGQGFDYERLGSILAEQVNRRILVAQDVTDVQNEIKVQTREFSSSD